MKILLTGAGGQLATELLNLPKDDAISFVACSRADLDITDINSVNSQIQKQQPDWVVNTAAYTAVDKAETNAEKAYAVNCKGVENLARSCRDADIPLLHISTDYVFDGEQSQPYTETQTANPINIYGQTKLAGEKCLIDTWNKHIILRTAWVFGNYGSNFMKTMCRLAKEKESLSIVGDQYGSPTATYDIAQAILAIIQQAQASWGIYHFTNQGGTTWFDFAKAIIELDSKKNNYAMPTLVSITTDEYPTAAKRPKHSVLNCEKLRKTFKITPRTWQQALQATLETS